MGQTLAFPAAMFLVPTAAAQGAHSGVVQPRTTPELSDVALFAAAVGAVWWTRRALRRRAAARKD